MEILPLELIKHICGYLPLYVLAKIRLLNRDCDCIARETNTFIKWKEGLKQWKKNTMLKYDKNLSATGIINKIYSEKYLNTEEKLKYFKIVYQLCNHLFDPNAIFMAACRIGENTIAKYIYSMDGAQKILCLEDAGTLALKYGNMELFKWISVERKRKKTKSLLLPLDYDIFCYILKFVSLRDLARLSNVSKNINGIIKNDPYYSSCVRAYNQCGKLLRYGKIYINNAEFVTKIIRAKTSLYFKRLIKDIFIGHTMDSHIAVLEEACKIGHVDIVSLWACNSVDTKTWFVGGYDEETAFNVIKDCFKEACKNGHLDVAIKIMNLYEFEIPAPISTLWAVCAKGHLDVAKFIVQKSPHILDKVYCDVAFQMACANGHVDIALWLISVWTVHGKFQLQLKSDDDIVKNFQMACTNGYIGIAKILKDLYPEVISGTNLYESLMQPACENNHTLVVIWLLEICPEINLHMNNDYLFKNIYKYNRKIQDLLEKHT